MIDPHSSPKLDHVRIQLTCVRGTASVEVFARFDKEDIKGVHVADLGSSLQRMSYDMFIRALEQLLLTSE
jgi:hypothetical protein